MTEEEKEKIEEAISIILRGIDIESSALILEKAIMDNFIISAGRVNILKIATRQILNFIEEYKNKGYLDVVREKVKANEENKQLKKQIDLMAEEIRKTILIVKHESKFCQYEEDCKNIRCKDCIKQYFEKQAKENEGNNDNN